MSPHSPSRSTGIGHWSHGSQRRKLLRTPVAGDQDGLRPEDIRSARREVVLYRPLCLCHVSRLWPAARPFAQCSVTRSCPLCCTRACGKGLPFELVSSMMSTSVKRARPYFPLAMGRACLVVDVSKYRDLGYGVHSATQAFAPSPLPRTRRDASARHHCCHACFDSSLSRSPLRPLPRARRLPTRRATCSICGIRAISQFRLSPIGNLAGSLIF